MSTKRIVLQMDPRLAWYNPMYWLWWRRRFFKADRAYLAAFRTWQAQAHDEAQFNQRKGVLMDALVTPEGVQYVRWLVTPPPRWEDFW